MYVRTTYYTETEQTHILSLSMLLLLLQDYTCCPHDSASHELRRIALCFSALVENMYRLNHEKLECYEKSDQMKEFYNKIQRKK